MSVLASLVRAYDRLADRGVVPVHGYSMERIGFLIPLHENGRLAGVPVDLRVGDGKRRAFQLMAVPAPSKRSGRAPRASFLWDNTAFALGVTATGKDAAARFASFRKRHEADLSGTDDAGLLALLRFVRSWQPAQFAALSWPEDMKDQNVAFVLAGECPERMLHDRPAARALWRRLAAAEDGSESICLVTGERGPVARVHPAVRGVWGAQPSGASLVSFNLDAFTSYGHKQGTNAPVGETAAVAYGAALSHFLKQGSPHRVQIGNISLVFWAEANGTAEAEAVSLAGDMFGSLSGGRTTAAGKMGAVLAKIHACRPVAELRPDLPPDVRFCVLGLTPNVARLSVRLWIEDDFADLAMRYAQHVQALQIDPPPRPENASIGRLLLEAAPTGKAENIPSNLAGELLRAILTGRPYPRTLLTALLIRLRSDKQVNGLRVALLKAVLISRQTEVPVSLDPGNRDPGYLLGRLFAIYEHAQVQAIGKEVSTTIRDHYYATASASPRAVFPILQRKVAYHLSSLRRDKPRRAEYLDRRISEIFSLAGTDLFVPTLTAPRQALFAIGYYHQRNGLFPGREAPEATSSIQEIMP